MSTIPPDPADPSSQLPPPADPFAAAAAPLPPAAANGAPTPEKPAPGWKAWIAAGAVAAVVAVGAGFVLGNGSSSSGTQAAAAAQAGGTASSATGMPAGGPGGGTVGTVTANADGTLTVETTDGASVTIETTDATTVTETAEGSADDLAVGDNVRVMGTSDDDGDVTATVVIDSGDVVASIGGPGGGAPPTGSTGTPPSGMEPPDGAMAGGMGGAPTAGEITAIDGDVLTVETAEGETMTVTLADDTTVSVAEEIDVADIAEGDTVMVMGETSDDVVTASTIRLGEIVGAGGMPGGMPGGASGGGADAAGTTTT